MDDYLINHCPKAAFGSQYADCAVTHERLAGSVKYLHKEFTVLHQEVKDSVGRSQRMEEMLRIQQATIDEIHRNTKVIKEDEEKKTALELSHKDTAVTRSHLVGVGIVLLLSNLGVDLITGLLVKSPALMNVLIKYAEKVLLG